MSDGVKVQGVFVVEEVVVDVQGRVVRRGRDGSATPALAAIASAGMPARLQRERVHESQPGVPNELWSRVDGQQGRARSCRPAGGGAHPSNAARMITEVCDIGRAAARGGHRVRTGTTDVHETVQWVGAAGEGSKRLRRADAVEVGAARAVVPACAAASFVLEAEVMDVRALVNSHMAA